MSAEWQMRRFTQSRWPCLAAIMRGVICREDRVGRKNKRRKKNKRKRRRRNRRKRRRELKKHRQIQMEKKGQWVNEP